MAKRVAAKQLTMENYDRDEDEEHSEADTGPQMASPEVLKTRPIAKARRRSELNASTDEPKKTFAGFSGFKGFASNSLQTNSNTLNPFTSLTKTETKDNTIRTSTPLLPTQTNGRKPNVEKPESTTESNAGEDSEDVYDKKLKQLNQSFSKHINSYMNRSEYYDFSKICREYIDYHKKIESEANSATNSVTKAVSSEASRTASKTLDNANESQDSAKSSETTSLGQKPQSSAGFFTSQTSSVSESSMFAKPNIQFNLNPIKPIGITSGFSATESTTTVTEAKTEETNEEDTDEPPKVESIEHKEADSVYTKKCKLFFKKGDDWSNKGVGFLFIKKEAPTSTAQLLIRADNKLGTILLHISLLESIPVSMAPQKKGVLVSCVPNPPLDPKAKTQESVTFLIRVKAEDTEELLDNLNKYKSNQ